MSTKARSSEHENDAASILQGIRKICVSPDGTVQVDGDRRDHLNAVRAILERGCDVTVQINGFRPREIGRAVRAVFDFALDAEVPVQFEYRGELLRLAPARLESGVV